MLIRKYLYIMATLLASTMSCSGSANKASSEQTAASESTTVTPGIKFNADSAYAFVQRQCDFGPRVPNTQAHRDCALYLESELRRNGADVTVQKASLKAFDGTMLQSFNIIGEFYPEKKERVLLLAHWDTRPWADRDEDESKHKEPVMGANDGGSGVGVLLEIERLLRSNEPNVGIDILFLDSEDWGSYSVDDSWALGAQYWANNPHREGYVKPRYGILLDMVGDIDAVFSKEYFSSRYAGGIVDKVWATAQQLGYSRFVNREGGAITDDHLQINQMGIPCIDIIDMRENSSTGFFPMWHTTGDTMERIDRTSLEAVGQTLTTLFLEKK